MLTQAPKGTVDMLPKDAHRWQSIQEQYAPHLRIGGLSRDSHADF